MNCKKHRHFKLGLQVPHIYEIVPKTTNFFHKLLQKTLVACLDRFKCVYDKGGPHPSTWQHCSHDNAVRRRYTLLAHQFEPGGSNTPKRCRPHPQPSLSPVLLPLSASACSPPPPPPTSPTAVAAASPWFPGLMTTAARTLTSTPTQLQTRASSR